MAAVKLTIPSPGKGGLVEPEPYDLAVIGGGINGAGIARDAAGRGLSVLLCEQRDLGAATSSASTKLIHGGLRYLEHFALRLVREALIEREVLLGIAPHIVRPMRFVMPHVSDLRPSWMIRLGLLLYDNLGGRKHLLASEAVALAGHPAGGNLSPECVRGFIYSDCWVDDSRLVVLNTLSAAENGAEVLPRTQCIAAHREKGLWRLTLCPTENAGIRSARARALVNATGPWVSETLDGIVPVLSRRSVRLVKGSHFVVPRLYGHNFSYVFQNDDHRVVFVIPYEDNFTLIGTTEVEYADDPYEARMTEDEATYLCAAVNRYLKVPVDANSIVWSFAGVRLLVDDTSDDTSTITRDYSLDVDHPPGEAPVVSVFGGKITTYRKLAEQVLGILKPSLGFTAGSWTGSETLPGGDIGDSGPESFAQLLCSRYQWLPEALAHRFARTYGTRTYVLLDGIDNLEGMGRDFGSGLYEAEVHYVRNYEWAVSSEDVLWRRTKLGLCLNGNERAALDAWILKSDSGHS